MSTFIKQHLIFTPEHDKGSQKITRELNVQNRHVVQSCEPCSKRQNSIIFPLHSRDIKFTIFQQKKDSLKLWNQTLANIAEGKISKNDKPVCNIGVVNKTVPDKQANDGISTEEVIYLDFDGVVDLTNDSNLPNLSNMSSTSALSPNSSITTSNCSSPRSDTDHWSSEDLSESSDDELLGINQSNSSLNQDDCPPLKFNKKDHSKDSALTWEIGQKLIYTKDPNSFDHIFWVNKKNRGPRKGKLALYNLRNKFKKAKEECDSVKIDSVQSEIERKEAFFLKEYVKKVEYDESLPKIVPLPRELRQAIYNDKKRNTVYRSTRVPGQSQMLKALRKMKKDVNAMRVIRNKFAEKVENDLFHYERIYKEKYLILKYPNGEALAMEKDIEKEKLKLERDEKRNLERIEKKKLKKQIFKHQKSNRGRNNFSPNTYRGGQSNNGPPRDFIFNAGRFDDDFREGGFTRPNNGGRWSRENSHTFQPYSSPFRFSSLRRY